MRSYWYHSPDSGHPPPSIQRPDQFDGSAQLSVLPWEPDLSAAKQRALVREWCTALPTLNGVRKLWLGVRASQALFEAACQVPGLEGLWIKHSGIKSLSAISDSVRLRYFHLGSSTALESIEPLASCGHLHGLALENIKRISRLDPLSELTSLEELSVSGSMWTTQRVETLRPLGTLTELRSLGLVNLRAADGTLAPLFALRNLEGLHIALWWPPAEIARLRELNPRLRN